MQRSRTEWIFIATITIVWATAVMNGIVTGMKVDPWIHYIFFPVVGAVLGVKIWRNGKNGNGKP